MASSSKTAVSPLWPHYAAAGTVAIAVVLGLLPQTYHDSGWQDSIRCGALLSTGQWLDTKFRNWQPEGCMVHQYKTNDVTHCLASQRIVFAGDSITRQLYYSFAHAADPSLPNRAPSDGAKHKDATLRTKGGTELLFYWDPFLNGTNSLDLLQSSNRLGRPALAVFGSGLWYLRHRDSGGIAAWEAMIDKTYSIISQNADNIADQIIWLPVENPVSSKLSSERSATIHPADVEAMNSDLVHRVTPPPPSFSFTSEYVVPSKPSKRKVPISLPVAFNLMLDDSQTKDGLHFSDPILKAQANLLLNLRCNDLLPKRFPLDKTCCSSYPRPPFLELLVLFVLLAWGPLARLVAKHNASGTVAAFFPAEDIVMPMFIFGVACSLLFFADRTGIWLKEHKQFDPWAFGGLSALALVTGLATMKRADKDLGFLNREQTDEWKGWMQRTHIYCRPRFANSSLLSHFGFSRVAQILVRLNLLTIALAYAMNTGQCGQIYYFAPLVSWWYLIIYFTLFVGAKYNDRTAFVLAKITVSMALHTWFMHESWILKELFEILEGTFQIEWVAREWNFRVTLDQFIVYVGMLTAIAFLKIREIRLTDHPSWPLASRCAIGASVFSLFWFFWFELTRTDKFAYNAWHPYVSAIPVLAFVILRNANTALRSSSSRVFAFIGTCSLETFIMQYHFWLAGDTKGVLLVIPGTAWRPLNMVITTVMFIWLSHKVAEATGVLTAWICGTRKKTLPTSNPPAANNAQPESIPLTSDIGDQVASGVDQPRSDVDTERGSGRTPGRWLDRLADGPAGPTKSNFGNAIQQYIRGLPGKLAACMLVLWALNLAWPTKP
ncbi:O-acetyltransferase [Rhizoctonia solani AG-1 IA]|uniref:O-acetyltransferase n=1 Tax=Thanatephorus cucumeris (strain AG1-IA) TaxID=983506 RepID=L8X7A9_THACA|nr:O-acetyltransferase [Rhizoctonia solani AG-1 IA]